MRIQFSSPEESTGFFMSFFKFFAVATPSSDHIIDFDHAGFRGQGGTPHKNLLTYSSLPWNYLDQIMPSQLQWLWSQQWSTADSNQACPRERPSNPYRWTPQGLPITTFQLEHLLLPPRSTLLAIAMGKRLVWVCGWAQRCISLDVVLTSTFSLQPPQPNQQPTTMAFPRAHERQQRPPV